MLYRSEKFPALILRPFLVYGNNQSAEKLVPYVIDSCLKDVPFGMTEGNQYREFIHINDFVDLITIISNSEDKELNGKIFDVNSGDILTVFEIVNLIKEIIGKGRPDFGKIKRRESDISLLYSSSKALYKELKWKRKISIKEGLKKVIDYRRSNIENS
tara:strand:- start:16 stop:489 length:474 start_codon:yes stop_codon:yes gene_type:complete